MQWLRWGAAIALALGLIGGMAWYRLRAQSCAEMTAGLTPEGAEITINCPPWQH